MINKLATIVLFLSILTASAQNVSFTHEITVEGDMLTIRFSGVMAEGWHVYSTNQSGGPISASFTLESSQGCSLSGDLQPVGSPITKFDQMFGTEVSYFEKNAVFVQKIKIEADFYSFSGYMQYGACNDVMCLPPKAVNISYSGQRAKKTENKDDKKTTDSEIKLAPYKVITPPPPPEADATASADTPQTTINSLTDNELWQPTTYDSASTDHSTGNIWLIFLSCFAGGLLALLTPCVWPIIPMTVSFFLKRTDKRSRGLRDAFVYGISIIVIYVTLGLSITYFAGANALNALSTNAVFNIFFTILLIAFGLSFLSAFDISLPASWANAVDAKANKTTGMLSIFLMAFTLALVSFSCTGPIIGFLLVELSTLGNVVAPAIGMFGFALALALPFTLFAMFPSWLKKLPRSGSWLNTVKVVLGFIEIAFAFKFLSVADLAYGWHILDREVFIVIWAALAIAMALYLFGVVRLRHDDADSRIGTLRLSLGIASAAFALYLIPGLWGAPLKAVSAFVPPVYTQDFKLGQNMPHAQFVTYEEGLAFAREAQKPVLVDFTGYGCVNCRQMEQNVWTDPDVASLLNDSFVLISLYVDDKTPLPERIETEENGSTTILRTVGDKWSYLQRYKFGVNAQPYYTALGSDGHLLCEPHSFDTNPLAFKNFLNEAINNYKNRQR